MLCSGIRPFFDWEESEHYRTLRIIDKECAKKVTRWEAAGKELRLERTMIPGPAIEDARKETLPSVEQDVFGNFLLDNEPIHTLCYGPSSARLTKNLFRFLVALCDAGFRPKFLYPQWWYGHTKEWSTLGFDDIHSCDLLYVERLDVKGGTDYARGEVFAAVQQRVASCLPTIVTLGSSPEGRNDLENELLKEVLRWERVPNSLK